MWNGWTPAAACARASRRLDPSTGVSGLWSDWTPACAGVSGICWLRPHTLLRSFPRGDAGSISSAHSRVVAAVKPNPAHSRAYPSEGRRAFARLCGNPRPHHTPLIPAQAGIQPAAWVERSEIHGTHPCGQCIDTGSCSNPNTTTLIDFLAKHKPVSDGTTLAYVRILTCCL